MSSRLKRLKHIFFLCLLIISGCKSEKDNYGLSTEVTKYSTHSLDIHSIIGNDYTIITHVVKNNVLLLKAIKYETSYFIGIDISKQKELFIIQNPSNDYISSTFDLYLDTVFSLSALIPSEIFIRNIITKEGVQKKIIKFDKLIRPGQIYLNQNQVFLVNDVYGVTVINRQNFNITNFHNESPSGILNPQSSTMSFPIDDMLNLISGNTISEDTIIQLSAISNDDRILWTYNINQNSKREEVSILNIDSLFVVKYDNHIVGLRKEDGTVLWHDTLANSIKKIYKWENKIFIYSLVTARGTYADDDDSKHILELYLYNSNDGKRIWRTDITSKGVPHIGILSDELIICDNVSFSNFKLNDGKIRDKTTFHSKRKHHYTFEIVTDIVTGTNFLKSYDEKIYW